MSGYHAKTPKFCTSNEVLVSGSPNWSLGDPKALTPGDAVKGPQVVVKDTPKVLVSGPSKS